MTQPITELTDRMREIFGLVVEAYLARGRKVAFVLVSFEAAALDAMGFTRQYHDILGGPE
jgi:hypothetical protein